MKDTSDGTTDEADMDLVVRRLRDHYDKVQKIWNREPFTSLIGTILSQRTRDENTARASRALFARYGDARGLAEADVEEVEELIRPAGFFRVKARQIKEVARRLLEEHDGRVPDDIEELLALPGVGRKTANCVLVYGFNKRAIPVDVHVHRISNRLGWVSTDTPEETERELERTLPERYWLEINDLLVTHGQNICTPRGPKCPKCPVKDICPKKISVDERGR